MITNRSSRITTFILALLFSAFAGYNLKAQSAIDTLKVRLDTSTNKWNKARLYVDVSWEYLYNFPVLTKKYALDLLKFAETENMVKAQSSAYGLLGLYHEVTGDYQSSIESYVTAIELIERVDSLKDNASSHYGNLAIVYHHTGDYQKAIYYRQKEMQILKKYKATRSMVNGYNSLGNTFTQLGKTDTALACYQKALDLNSGKDKRLEAMITSNIGDIYLQSKNYEEAQKAYWFNYSFSQESPNATSTDKLDANFDLAELYLKTNDYRKSKNYLDSSLKIALRLSNYNYIEGVYDLYSQYYEQAGDFKNALLYRNKNYHIRDSIEGVNVLQKMAEIESKFQLQTKELEIDNLSATAKLKDLELVESESRTFFWAAVSVLIALLLLSSIALLLNIRKKSRAMSKQNEIIKDKHQTIESLMRENHHRIKNNLQVVSSLLKLQSKNVKSDKARTALLEAFNRIKTIAMMHQNLQGAQTFETIPLQNFISQLTENIKSSMLPKDTGIQIISSIDPFDLPTDISISIGLIVNELVTNSLKYAFDDDKGLVEVNIGHCEKCLYIEINDNGKGFESDFNPKELASLGYKIVNSLTSKLKGELKIANEKGAHIKITIPYD